MHFTIYLHSMQFLNDYPGKVQYKSMTEEVTNQHVF